MRVGGRVPWIDATISSTRRVGATSWTRNILAPSAAASAVAEPISIDHASYVRIQDLDTLKAWVAKATAKGVVAFDTETDALSSATAGLCGVSLAINAGEAAYRKESDGLQARMAALENDPQRRAAERDMVTKRSAWESATTAAPGHDHQAEHDAYLAAKGRFEALNDPYLRERAKLRTLPSHEGELVGNLDAYDRQLMKDVAFLKEQSRRTKLPLRPHYQALMQAHDDEFLHGKGLTDEKVISFFDNFVHDSLAGFAKDVTLPSDPRCCYIGGDDELKYANNRVVEEKSAG